MTTLQIIIRKIAVHFSKPIWSFIRNCVFWLGHLNKVGQAKLQAKAFSKMRTIHELMQEFQWAEDRVGDWTPWVITLAYRGLKDDCDGAAALAKWWFKQHGIKSDIFNLYSAAEGHTVCVTKDRETMVTNERVVNLNPACWEKEMLDYFGNKYTEII